MNYLLIDDASRVVRDKEDDDPGDNKEDDSHGGTWKDDKKQNKN